MTPGVYPLALYRGDSYHWQFTLWQDTARTQPVDLTGVTVKSQIRDKPAGSLLLTMTLTVTLPNIIAMDLLASDCASLPPSGGNWDLQLTYPNGDVGTILMGPVRITVDVTDSAIPLTRPARLSKVG
jgi:hypothetical protein